MRTHLPNPRTTDPRRARTASALWIFLIALLAGSCPAPPKPQPPYKPLATLEEVMHGMVIPNAHVVWKSVGTIITKEGTEEIRPKTEDDWIDIEASATILMEAGNLLMMEGRAKDNGKWYDLCRALVDAGDGVRQAAKSKDPEQLFTRGGYLFDACQACHFQYRFTEKDPNTFRSH